MKPHRILGWAVLVLPVLAGLPAAPVLARGQVTEPAGMLEAGQLLFETSCASSFCHGPGGAGGEGPRLIERNLAADRVRDTILKGRPGTPMPPFQDVLEPVQVQMLVAYVQSLSPQMASKAAAPAPAAPAEPVAAAAPPKPAGPVAIGSDKGDPASGARLFFDATRIDSCRACHSHGGRGGPVGPDLAALAERPVAEIFNSLVGSPAPSAAYPGVLVTLRDGSRIAGIRRSESDEALRLFDVSTIPPVARTLYKSDIAEVEDDPAAAIDHGRLGYSRQELLDLAAFLKVGQPK